MSISYYFIFSMVGNPAEQRRMEIIGRVGGTYREFILHQDVPLSEQPTGLQRALHAIWEISDLYFSNASRSQTVSLYIPSDRFLELGMMSTSAFSKLTRRILRLGRTLTGQSIDLNHMFIQNPDDDTYVITKTHNIDQVFKEVDGDEYLIRERPIEEQMILQKYIHDNRKIYNLLLRDRQLPSRHFYNQDGKVDAIAQERVVTVPPFQEVSNPSSRAINRFLIMIMEGSFGKID